MSILLSPKKVVTYLVSGVFKINKELNGLDEYGKCKNCGKRGITYTTEKKSDDWVWKKICSTCSNEIERQILDIS